MNRKPLGGKLWFGGGCTLLLAIATGVVWSGLRPPEVTADVESTESSDAKQAWDGVVQVEVAKAERADLSLRREATGYLKAARRVEIVAEVAGKVTLQQVEEGERVALGQLLLRLDSREHRLEVEEAEAEWLKIRAQYAINYEVKKPQGDRDNGKAEVLFEEGLISKQEFAAARRLQDGAELLSGRQQSEIRAATSGLAQAEQRLERARLTLERTEIEAPFAGRIADLRVTPGQRVAVDEVLLTLLGDEHLQVDVDVLEADVVRLQAGAPARVRVPAMEDLELEGWVHTINPQVDPDTGTARVNVALPNPRGQLMVGLFAYVELEVGRLADRLLIPAAAVLERQERQLVFRVDEGRALWTYVTPGARSEDLVEIIDGLSKGDTVAINGHLALAHGAPVEVIP